MENEPSSPDQTLTLKASMASLTQSVGMVDNMLALTLADMLTPRGVPGDWGLASLIIFSQGSIERRVDLFRKIITYRMSQSLGMPRHTYDFKMAEFILKSFNKIWDGVAPHIWVRNTAAHGDVQSGDPPTLIPSPFDMDGVSKFHARRGVKAAYPFPVKSMRWPQNGLTETELLEHAEQINQSHRKFIKLSYVLKAMKDFGPSPPLDEAIAELGRDLKLTPPLRSRPPRQAKPRASRKTHNHPKV